jgi:hypothetical protein
MRASIFTSDSFYARLLRCLAACGLLAAALALGPRGASDARAAEGDTLNDAGTKSDKTTQPEEEDFTTTPYTEYGEFNSDKDEEETTRFFQYGRFFGLAVGLGSEILTGNRGMLWQGGTPMVDLKLQYWFDFNFALDMDLYYAQHFYEAGNGFGGHVDVNLIHLGLDLKYYFDTKDIAAPIAFTNPYLIVGLGSYSKTENITDYQNSATDSSAGMTAGVGFEFALKPRKVYLDLESKVHFLRFKDTYIADFNRDPYFLPDLTGMFFTFTLDVLFTW